MPANWGMIARTSLFCIDGYTMGSGEWLALCAVDPNKAIIAQLAAVILLYTLHRIIVPVLKREEV